MTDALLRSLHDRAAALPPQLHKAARWVLENPREVALLSMRAQARAAGVQPATMTRLAQALGLDGFEAVRTAHAERLRHGSAGLAGPAAQRLPHTDATASGTEALADRLLAEGATRLGAMATPGMAGALVRAAARMAAARQVFCLGQRSSFPVAWHLHYALRLGGAPAVLLDGAGGTGLDALHGADSRDVLVAVGVRPYARAVVAASRTARDQGAGIIALTDSAVSPLTRPDEVALIVPTEGAGFLHAMTPAFAVAEALAALVAHAGGAGTLARLRGVEAQLSTLDTWLDPTEEPTDD